jgi:ATP-dependent Lon protease
MRDFRDAKSMAQTLRQSLTVKSVTVSHSESLELVSKMLGAADWNTLSAVIRSGPRGAEPAEAARPELPGRYPAIPLRDLVPFPTATYPVFVGRQKTMRALDHAFERQREVVLAVQRDSAIDNPTADDFHEIGVLGRLIQLARLDDGTMKVLIEVYRRVTIRRFLGDSDGYLADIGDLSEGPIPEAPELIRQALAHFQDYAEARDFKLPRNWESLELMSDPGRVADIICTHFAASLGDKQELLATLDPVARLEKVDAMLVAG